jgi:hypothetical protein
VCALMETLQVQDEAEEEVLHVEDSKLLLYSNLITASIVGFWTRVGLQILFEFPNATVFPLIYPQAAGYTSLLLLIEV